MALHLKKSGSTGHLLKTGDGHLVNECGSAFGEEKRSAPSNIGVNEEGAPEGTGGATDVIWHCGGLGLRETNKVQELSIEDFSLIREASSPGPSPDGIGGTSGVLWHSDWDDKRNYELSTTDFSVLQQNNAGYESEGIGGDASTVWNANTSNEKILELSDFDLSTIRSQSSPGTHPDGIGGIDTTIWHSDRNKELVYELDTSDLSVIRSATPPNASGGVEGIGGDNDTIWYNSNSDVYELCTG